MLGWAVGETLPLQVDQLEVEKKNQEQSYKNREIVGCLHKLTAVEMSEQSFVDVLLISQVDHRNVARVETGRSRDENGQQSQHPASRFGEHRKHEDGPTDHPINQGHNSSRPVDTFFLNHTPIIL